MSGHRAVGGVVARRLPRPGPERRLVFKGLVSCSLWAVLAAACASAPPSPSPDLRPIELHVAPANLGCDAVAAPYRSVTFRIDAAATEQVSAVADTGVQLRTFWSEGFRGGSADDPVVRDPAGAVVVADGDVLDIPAAAWPRLRGYFVCPSLDALYVLLRDPE